MDLILLAGNSRHNKEWIDKVEQKLSVFFNKAIAQYYKHWETGLPIINLDEEIGVLVQTIDHKKKYAIFAKSGGIALTLKAIYEGRINPEKCIFVGLPVSWSQAQGFDIDLWIQGFSTPALFIQATSDTAGTFEEVKKYLERMKVNRYDLVEIPGRDHEYMDVEKIKTEVGKWV